VPDDGALPEEALAGLGQHGFGLYVHVPFCSSRCGYCDFNTYTAGDLGGVGAQSSYADTVLAEVDLAARVLGGASRPPVQTVFFGGGTPTLLPAADLGRILHGLDAAFGLAGDVEVTTEANPESVDLRYLRELRAAGFTRVSLGMQSVAPQVLVTLERRHTPGRAVAAVDQARTAGFEHVNVDLIYSTPGETSADLDASVSAALSAGVDHLSAYALIVEDGTRLAARVRRGEIEAPDDDIAADRYLAVDAALSAAGLCWYEVSNWAAAAGAQCRHNLTYWRGGDWWGFGPGAHSHVNGVRWWNVRHPSSYAERLAAGRTPAHGRELLGPAERHAEEVLLRVRLAEGLDLAHLTPPGARAVPEQVAAGLLEPRAAAAGRVVLTLRGRLFADAVVRALLP
jgi:oxygen-independent coproporphyrinogen-3 oxidase